MSIFRKGKEMKWTPLVLALALGIAVCADEEKKPVITVPKGWNVKLAALQAQQKANPDSVIAILFAGQDQPKLQQEVLQTPVFAKLVKEKKLLLAYVPLPKPAKKEGGGEGGAEGEKDKPAKPDPAALARAQFKVRGPNCMLILLDAKGKELGRLYRIEPAVPYTIRIRKYLAPVPEIIRIARSNNLKNMTKYLEEHPDELDTTDAFGATAVSEAVRRNNLKMLEFLFSKKANPNRKGDMGLSPIMLWSQRNQKKTEIGDLLLKNGAAIDARDDQERTALMIAVQANAMDTVKWLLDRGARVNAYDEKGATPLMYAIRRKNLDMVKLLHQYGAKLGQQDKQNNSPLHVAAMMPDGLPYVQFLLKNGAMKNVRNNRKQTPFMVARDPKAKQLLKVK